MQKLLIIILLSMLFVSCGIKDNPEYKSQVSFNKSIYKI